MADSRVWRFLGRLVGHFAAAAFPGASGSLLFETLSRMTGILAELATGRNEAGLTDGAALLAGRPKA
jgi:hypothetical protein